eukprot:PhF_6_TR22583/c0_g1_i6/m.32202
MSCCLQKFDLFLEVSLYLEVRDVLLMGSTNTLTYRFLMKDPEDTIWTNLYGRDFHRETDIDEYAKLTRHGIVTMKELYINAFHESEGLSEIFQLTRAIREGKHKTQRTLAMHMRQCSKQVKKILNASMDEMNVSMYHHAAALREDITIAMVKHNTNHSIPPIAIALFSHYFWNAWFPNQRVPPLPPWRPSSWAMCAILGMVGLQVGYLMRKKTPSYRQIMLLDPCYVPQPREKWVQYRFYMLTSGLATALASVIGGFTFSPIFERIYSNCERIPWWCYSATVGYSVRKEIKEIFSAPSKGDKAALGVVALFLAGCVVPNRLRSFLQREWCVCGMVALFFMGDMFLCRNSRYLFDPKTTRTVLRLYLLQVLPKMIRDHALCQGLASAFTLDGAFGFMGVSAVSAYLAKNWGLTTGVVAYASVWCGVLWV